MKWHKAGIEQRCRQRENDSGKPTTLAHVWSSTWTSTNETCSVQWVYRFMNGGTTRHTASLPSLVKLAQEVSVHLMVFLINSLSIDFCLGLTSLLLNGSLHAVNAWEAGVFAFSVKHAALNCCQHYMKQFISQTTDGYESQPLFKFHNGCHLCPNCL